MLINLSVYTINGSYIFDVVGRARQNINNLAARFLVVNMDWLYHRSWTYNMFLKSNTDLCYKTKLERTVINLITNKLVPIYSSFSMDLKIFGLKELLFLISLSVLMGKVVHLTPPTCEN